MSRRGAQSLAASALALAFTVGAQPVRAQTAASRLLQAARQQLGDAHRFECAAACARLGSHTVFPSE